MDYNPFGFEKNEPPSLPKRLNVETVYNMIHQSILDAWSPSNIALLSREILAKVDRETAVQLFHPGTVVADTYDGINHTANVVMDGSGVTGPTAVTVCYVLIPQVMFPGQRVMVFYDKPHIAYIIGTITLPIPPGIRVSIPCGGDDPSWSADQDRIPFAFTCVEDQAGGMLIDAGNEVITVPQDGMYRARFSGDFSFSDPGTFWSFIRTPQADANMSRNFSKVTVNGTISVVVLRMAMRAGDTLYMELYTADGASGSLSGAVLEVEYSSVFTQQVGCACPC